MQERGTPTRPLTCEQVFRKLDDFVDRELSPAEMRRVQEHIERCAGCAAESHFEATWIGEVRAKLQRVALPAELMHRIVRRLTEAAVAAPGPLTDDQPSGHDLPNDSNPSNRGGLSNGTGKPTPSR